MRDGHPRVLVAHPSSELYGSDRQVAHSVAGFVGAGWATTVVLPAAGPLVSKLEGAEVRLMSAPVLRRSVLRFPTLVAWLIMSPFVVLRLAREIRRLAPDIVLVNTVTLPHWILAARLARTPVVVHVHEAEEMIRPAVRKLLYAPLLWATVVIANSRTTRRVLTTTWPVLIPRVRVVVNGVPDAGAAPAARTVPGRLVVVSRLSPRKGLEAAVDALAELVRRGRAASLTICGSVFPGYEWYEQRLRERVRCAGLDDRIRFTGFVPSVADELAEAQVVLAPSFGESFGNAAVEAMLAQRPLIASDVQGLAEIVDDAHTGLLVRPGDHLAMADAVDRLLADPVLAGQLARNGRAKAEQCYGLATYHQAVVDVLDHQIADSGRRQAKRHAVPAAVAALIAALLSGCGSGGAAGSPTSSTPPQAIVPAPGTTAAGTAPAASPTAGVPRPGTSAAAPAPTSATRVAAPGGGNIYQTVAARPRSTAPAVPLSAPATLPSGVSLRVVRHSVVDVKAQRPGELSGPAVALTVRIINNSSRPISLNSLVVTVADRQGTPLVPLTTSPTKPLFGALAARATATGVYVFSLPKGQTARNPFHADVSVNTADPVILFIGDLT